jgi:hypothetical protein
MNRVETRSMAGEATCATDGRGPLLERDYLAVIGGASCEPEDAARLIRGQFEQFAPPETARFERTDGHACLEVGDELAIRVALRGECRVRVIHCDARGLTLRTLRGHPEAGRITFGADRDGDGRLTVRIRSRTRASCWSNYLGFLLLGKQLQSRCWIRFLDRVAETCGGRVHGRVRVNTRRVEPEPGDGPDRDEPTFRAGDGAR